MILDPCHNWKTLLFIKFYRYPEVIFNCNDAAFLKQVRVLFFYLHNNITMLIAMLQDEALVYNTC